MAVEDAHNQNNSTSGARGLVQQDKGEMSSGSQLENPHEMTASTRPGGSALTLVQSEVGEVKSDQLIDAYKAASEASDRRYKTKKVLAIWRHQQANDRKIRKTVAYWVLGGMLFEILVAATAFFFIGFGLIQILDPWVARTFFVTVLAHVVAILMIIVKNLFPERKSDNLADITTIVEKL